MHKVYIGIITDKGEFGNLNALTAPWSHFDGLAVTYHGKTADHEYKLLNARKGQGFVELMKYTGNHSLSMNYFLFNPSIKIGDWILLRDSCERVNDDFAFNIKVFIRNLENLQINSVYQRSKLLLFKRFPHQEFSGTPHWGFKGAQGKSILIENQGWFARDEDYCYSVRDVNRGPYHFIDAFMRYYLINDSNHNLLGLENFGNPQQLFPILEQRRMEFLFYLQELGINNDIVSLRDYLVDTELLPDKMKYFINNNLILNQFYRYWCLDDLTVSPDIKAPIIQIN